MDKWAPIIAEKADHGSYGICITMLLSNYISFIDQHTWIVGAIGFFITWMTSIVFRVIDRRKTV